MKLIDELGLKFIQKLPAELAHTATISALQLGLASSADPLSDDIVRILQTELPVSKLKLPNPLGIAAGFDKNASVFRQCLSLGCGFVECGTVTPMAQLGNPKPRLFRLKEDGGVINRMGFNNSGLDAFIQRLSSRGNCTGIVGANVGANKTSEGAKRVEDYVVGIKGVWRDSTYLTLNISSPNTPGLRGLQGRAELEALLNASSAAIMEMQDVTKVSRPVFLKIAPDIDDEAIKDIVETVVKASGITGLIVSNTTISRPHDLKSLNAGQAGGLSGKPLFELSTQILKKVAKVVDGRLDIIGVGGIYDAKSAYEKIRAGADCFQLYSALVYRGAPLITEIIHGLAELLAADGFNNISEAVGADL